MSLITRVTSLAQAIGADIKALYAAMAAAPSSSQTLSNKTLASPVVTGSVNEQVFAVTDGGSVVLNPANGTIQTWTLGAARSPTLTLAAGQSMTIHITAGAFSVTWPTVSWLKVGGGGTVPTLTATGATVIVLWKIGTTIYGTCPGSA